MLSGTALVTASQGIQFLLLARVLGPQEFGRLAAVGGVTALLLPFSGAGAANVMVMRASRDAQLLPLYFGHTLGIVALTGTALALFASFGAVPLLAGQVSFELMTVFALSELFASKIVDVCWQAFVAREQLHLTSTFLLAQSVGRLIAAFVFAAVVDEPTAGAWAWWALASNGVVAACVLAYTIRRVGRPRFELAVTRREFAIGLPFAVGLSAKAFYTDADKIFLTRLAGAEVAGLYTAAFRVVQVALMPIRALSLALTARLFRAGDAGLEGALKLTLRILGPLSIGAAVVAVAFYVGAPLLTWIAGPRYGESVSVLRMQCLLPLVLAVQSMLQDALSSSGHQRIAALSQVVCAGVICALCVLLIPHYSWRGAAVASYAAQITLCGLMVWAIRQRRREARREAEQVGA